MTTCSDSAYAGHHLPCLPPPPHPAIPRPPAHDSFNVKRSHTEQAPITPESSPLLRPSINPVILDIKEIHQNCLGHGGSLQNTGGHAQRLVTPQSHLSDTSVSPRQRAEPPLRLSTNPIILDSLTLKKFTRAASGMEEVCRTLKQRSPREQSMSDGRS